MYSVANYFLGRRLPSLIAAFVYAAAPWFQNTICIGHLGVTTGCLVSVAACFMVKWLNSGSLIYAGLCGGCVGFIVDAQQDYLFIIPPLLAGVFAACLLHKALVQSLVIPKRRILAGALIGISSCVMVIFPVALATYHAQGRHSFPAPELSNFSCRLASLGVPSLLHPLWGQMVLRSRLAEGAYFEHSCYLGWVALALAAGGFSTWRRKNVGGIWGVVGLVFVTLALGPELIVWDEPLDGVVLPFEWLRAIIPGLGNARAPIRNSLGAVFALAMLAGIGFDHSLTRVTRRGVKLIITCGAIVMVGFDYLCYPMPTEALPRLEIFEQLGADQEQYPVLHLPFCHHWFHLRYPAYYQTIYRKPMYWGYPARAIPDHYPKICGDPMFKFLCDVYEQSLSIETMLQKNPKIIDAFSTFLARNRFRYVILQKQSPDSWISRWGAPVTWGYEPQRINGYQQLLRSALIPVVLVDSNQLFDVYFVPPP